PFRRILRLLLHWNVGEETRRGCAPDVDLREPRSEQLRAEIASVRQRGVGEQISGTIVCDSIGGERQLLAVDEAAQSVGRLLCEARAGFRRGDAEHVHALELVALCEAHVE